MQAFAFHKSLIHRHPRLSGFTIRASVLLMASWLCPAWQMFEHALEPWLNIDALASADTMVMEVLHFHQIVTANRELVATTLLPQLVTCLIISIAFLAAATLLGHYLAKTIYESSRPQEHAA